MFKDDLEMGGGAGRRVAKFIEGYLLLTLQIFYCSLEDQFFLTNNLEFIYQIRLIVLFVSHASPFSGICEEYRGKLIEFFLKKERALRHGINSPHPGEFSWNYLSSASVLWEVEPHSQTATGRTWASPGTLSFVEGWKEEQRESFEVCLSIFIFLSRAKPLKLTQRYGPLGPSTQHSFETEIPKHQMNRT